MRYEDVTENVYDILHNVVREFFPGLVNAKILCIFDLKKRMSKGNIVLARIKKSDDLIRHLTINNAGEEDGYDYIMFLDQMIWQSIEEVDKVRIVRHELRHCFITDEGNYSIIPHDIEDFAAEIELNSDDIRWSTRVAELCMHLYSQEREMTR